MPVRIGAKLDGSFQNPLQLLSDCHRRIERFLDALISLARASGDELTAERRDSLETALRYFQQGAPLHSRDEEESLFPRLRAVAAQSALAALDSLEADHIHASGMHQQVDALCSRWLERGKLEPDDALRLQQVLSELRGFYAAHIRIEDEEVFPLAGRVLPAAQVAMLGREMAQRRGLDPDNLPELSRCTQRVLDRLAGAVK